MSDVGREDGGVGALAEGGGAAEGDVWGGGGAVYEEGGGGGGGMAGDELPKALRAACIAIEADAA